MEPWIALGWIAGLTALYLAYRAACWMADRETAALTAAVEAQADAADAAWPAHQYPACEDISVFDRLDGVGSGR